MSETQPSPTLSCALVVELLPGYTEGSLNQTAQDAVRQHVETCEECRQSLAKVEREEGLGVLAVSAPDTESTPAAPRPRGRRQRWHHKTLYTGIGLAGLMGVGTLGGIAVARISSQPAEPSTGDLAPVRAVRRVRPIARRSPSGANVVSLLGVGNDETREAGFSLRRSVALRVHALGEGTGGQMYDYAWISNARTFEPVWIMDYNETGHAGGAEKNRVADVVIKLPEGDYLLSYTTDDSHATHSWNSDPPDDRDRWGVSLSTVNPRDARLVHSFDPSSLNNALVRLVGARDDVHLHGEFRLNRDSDVRIYAIGEGTGGEMDDYAWIEDAGTKHVVWRMNYPETSHAGGAEKNRMVNEVVRLPAGRYVAYYVTDDSHSFEEWNATAPRDAPNYGVTVLRVER
jgi:Putative zinc-finger